MTDDGVEADGAFEAVAVEVLERVEPDDDERRRLESVVETLLDRTRAAVADLPVDAEPVHVGSTARDTWIAGDRDVDVFVRFPTDLPREDLESYGLAVGHEVLPEGHEEYAEHPYVRGELDGFDVDLVPCYDVESAGAIRSAVDRTPFHSAYLAQRITPELAAEIRVFKQFLKGVSVYGSDLRTRGFSGYLTELLVLEYGGAEETVEAVAGWHPPVRLDPEGHGAREFDDPLVVIDPTDPERNVAAVLSAENVARLQHHTRELIAEPAVEAFFPEPRSALSVEALDDHIARRGTTPIALVFDAPDAVEDDLYPQLRRSLAGLGDELDRRGFSVFRRAAWAGDVDDPAARAVLLFELAVDELPAVERHVGPPVHVSEHASEFYDTYADDATVYGPFVDGDRYVVEREREFETAADLLGSDAVFDVRLGADVAEAMREGYGLLVGEEVTALADGFGVELAEYFDPRP